MNTDYLSFQLGVSFLVFILGICIFGASEKTLVRIAWFSLSVFMFANLTKGLGL